MSMSSSFLSTQTHRQAHGFMPKTKQHQRSIIYHQNSIQRLMLTSILNSLSFRHHCYLIWSKTANFTGLYLKRFKHIITNKGALSWEYTMRIRKRPFRSFQLVVGYTGVVAAMFGMPRITATFFVRPPPYNPDE